ncbi:archaeosortase family protein ArtE [Methanococcus maripaludis]|nr:archaeosortase family protein ArtE [Methanococcus maripaludis]
MNKKAKNLILDIIKFFIYSSIFYAILYQFKSFLIDIVTYQSYLMLKIVLSDVTRLDNTISISNITFLVEEPCTGIMTIALILGFVATVSKNLKEYIFGSVFCALLIYIGNIIRIIIIAVFTNNFGNGEYVHDNVSFIIIPLSIFVTILIWYKIREKLFIDIKLDG